MSKADYDFSDLDERLSCEQAPSIDMETMQMDDVKKLSKLGTTRSLLTYGRRWKLASIVLGLIIYVLGLEIYEGFAIIKDFVDYEADRNPLHIFTNGLAENPLIILLIGALSFAISFAIIGKLKIKDEPDKDERGFRLDKTQSAGSARFMTDREKRELFNYLDAARPQGNILGVDKRTKELITVPFEGSNFSNRNIALFGPPGTRKTSGVLIPNIYTNLQAGNSLVVTDPKGELYKETFAAALLMGYNVRVFNILGTQFKQSDGWDCMKMIRETPDVSAARTTAQIFANVLMSNTSGKVGDDFWWDANINLLTTVLLYVAKANSFVPYSVRTNYKDTSDESSDPNFDKERTIREAYALITSEDMGDVINEAIQNDPMGDGKLLGASYNIWKNHREAESIKAGLGIRLNIFQSEEVVNILSVDDINFRELADEKTIIYIVCADNDSTFKALLTLFVTFLFKEITLIADELPGSTLERPLFVILEECGNIGKIPNMSKYVSTVRSRNIGMLFCFQTLGQMKDIYGSQQNGRSEWETILAGCSIQVCLGGNDETTKKYFSDRSGTMSILTDRISEDRHKLLPEGIQKHTVLDQGKSTSITSRPVLSPDEIGHIKKDEILISPATTNVTIEKKYYYKNHPLYNAVLVDKKTGAIIGEHLTKEHMPKWRADELRASEICDAEKTLSDEERYTAKLAKRPGEEDATPQNMFEEEANLDRSYSSFKRRS